MMPHLAKCGINPLPRGATVEYLVQLFRALANHNRIRILRLLCVLGERDVSTIARATGLALPLASDHLRILTAAGLTWRRRSGRRVYYRPAEQPRNAVVAAVWTGLGRAFSSVRRAEPETVARAGQAHSRTRSDRALFACFTAFTHPRRLQILWYMSDRRTAALEDLGTQLSMSPRACLRHIDKLERRGLLRRKAMGQRTAYALTGGNNPLTNKLLRAVRASLVGHVQ